MKNISIHALRGEGDRSLFVPTPEDIISIHALRGEGDQTTDKLFILSEQISIHALRGEGDSRNTQKYFCKFIIFHKFF